MTQHTTLDGLLDRRLTIEQPKDGYRVAIDTVLLASAVRATGGEQIAEFGCGVAAASLCLGWRVPGLQITGFEIQPELVDLARRNVARNSLQSALTIHEADVTALPQEFASRFDHVMMNPPYHAAATHDVSGLASKRLANSENAGDLGRWLKSAARALKAGGGVTLVHRADRKDKILGLLAADFGSIDVILFLPKAGTPPKRLIVRAVKAAAALAVSTREVVLHRPDGRYTDSVETILRDGQSLDFVMT